MGKASRRKRYGAEEFAVASRPVGSAARSGRSAGSRPARAPLRPVEQTRLDAILARWDVGLAVLAWLFWFAAHFPGFPSAFGIPLWLIGGFGVGLLSPWMGLLLGVATVPFFGGAIDQPSGEVLRTISIHGAAIRVLLDRFVIGPAMGKVIRPGPPTWVVACAPIAAILYVVSVQTGALAVGGANGADPAFFASGIRWVIGGAAGMLSAWIAGSHLVYGREKTFTNMVLVVFTVAMTAALLAYFGVGGITLFTFPGVVNGRLAALGYPTPTAMGLAISLPFALAAAWRHAGRLSGWLAARLGGETAAEAEGVAPASGNGPAARLVGMLPYAFPFALVAVVFYIIALTISRGPMLALAAGFGIAALTATRLPRRYLVAGIAIGLVAAYVFLTRRYGSADPSKVIEVTIASIGSDADRVGTWFAAVQIAFGNPLTGGGWRAIERFGEFGSRAVAYSHNVILHGFAEGGFLLGIPNGAVVLYSVWRVWAGRRTMAWYVMAGAIVFFVCGFWDIPQVRSFASSMGGIAMGMAAGPVIRRATRPDEEQAPA